MADLNSSGRKEDEEVVVNGNKDLADSPKLTADSAMVTNLTTAANGKVGSNMKWAKIAPCAENE